MRQRDHDAHTLRGGAVTVVVARFDGLMGCGLVAASHEDRRLRVLASDLTGAAARAGNRTAAERTGWQPTAQVRRGEGVEG